MWGYMERVCKPVLEFDSEVVVAILTWGTSNEVQRLAP